MPYAITPPIDQLIDIYEVQSKAIEGLEAQNGRLLACVKEMYLWHHNYDADRNGPLDACAPAVLAEQILSEIGLLKGLE